MEKFVFYAYATSRTQHALKKIEFHKFFTILYYI